MCKTTAVKTYWRKLPREEGFVPTKHGKSEPRSMERTYKGYELTVVPSNGKLLWGVNDLACFKYIGAGYENTMEDAQLAAEKHADADVANGGRFIPPDGMKIVNGNLIYSSLEARAN